jgi:transposase
VLCESEDQPHLIDGLDRITRALGAVSRDWRFDRMATVISPGTGRVSASFSAVGKHYGVAVRPCPPRRGNRKGVVQKANHVAAQRFWRTLPDDVQPRGRAGAPGHLVRPPRRRPGPVHPGGLGTAPTRSAVPTC